jgi:type II secretory pathway predicted ATPase ExeA
MFLEHYGLIEQPFGVTPDPRFLHMGAKHREAMASLVYGTETNRGFLALIAQPGMGKTSLLLQLLERQRGQARSAFVFHTDADEHDFMRHILADLGLNGSGKDQASMHGMLNNVLLAEMNAGRRFILVIDEAQNLSERVLESVRLLSNFETPWMKLIQIVIAGQPQLAELLTRPSLAQLRQRISSVIHIEPFTTEETNAYIDHRLWVAGYTGPALFTAGARSLIARKTGGIPRNINNLCFNAMSIAYGAGATLVAEKFVREAAADAEIESLLPKPERARWNAERSRVIVAAMAKVTPSVAANKDQRPNRAVPVFAALCALMLLATISWFGWSHGVKTPFLDVLFAANYAASLQPARVKPSDEKEASEKSLSSEDSEVDSARPGTDRAAGKAAITGETSTGVSRLQHGEVAELSPSIAAGLSDNDRILTVAIQKPITLLDLSLRHLGRFDATILGEILELNPSLTDVNRIQPGQRVRLPLYLRDDFRLTHREAAKAEPIQTSQERP